MNQLGKEKGGKRKELFCIFCIEIIIKTNIQLLKRCIFRDITTHLRLLDFIISSTIQAIQIIIGLHILVHLTLLSTSFLSIIIPSHLDSSSNKLGFNNNSPHSNKIKGKNNKDSMVDKEIFSTTMEETTQIKMEKVNQEVPLHRTQRTLVKSWDFFIIIGL